MTAPKKKRIMHIILHVERRCVSLQWFLTVFIFSSETNSGTPLPSKSSLTFSTSALHTVTPSLTISEPLSVSFSSAVTSSLSSTTITPTPIVIEGEWAIQM